MLVDREDPDQIVQMHRLIWAFTVHLFLETVFHMVQPICCWCLLRPDISKEYPEHVLWCRNMKNIYSDTLVIYSYGLCLKYLDKESEQTVYTKSSLIRIYIVILSKH